MTKRGQIWKCEICGNIIEILHEGKDSLVCCNTPMKLQEEKLEDSEIGEKHVPVIDGMKVKIGQVEHPMTKEHYIEWVEASAKDGKTCKVFLKPEDKPEAKFDFEVSSARIYCNLHSLWKK